jgi:hypothetical protein
MRHLLPLLLLSFPSHSQKLKDYLPAAGFIFAGGMFEGTRDGALFHADGMGQWWNGKQSHFNKYKNRDISQGPAFFGSTTVFVAVTDAPHAFNFLSDQTNSFSYVFMPYDPNRRWKHLVLKAVIMNTIRQAGKSFVYYTFFPSKYKRG